MNDMWRRASLDRSVIGVPLGDGIALSLLSQGRKK